MIELNWLLRKLNKPKDCVTSNDDPYAKLTVLDIVKNACHERIYPVGRLDRNTTGVLLLTNDGDLAAKLTHPKYNKKKIYQVTLDKGLTQDDYDKIMSGIMLEDGEIKADEISFLDEDEHRKIIFCKNIDFDDCLARTVFYLESRRAIDKPMRQAARQHKAAGKQNSYHRKFLYRDLH